MARAIPEAFHWPNNEGTTFPSTYRHRHHPTTIASPYLYLYRVHVNEDSLYTESSHVCVCVFLKVYYYHRSRPPNERQVPWFFSFFIFYPLSSYLLYSLVRVSPPTVTFAYNEGREWKWWCCLFDFGAPLVKCFDLCVPTDDRAQQVQCMAIAAKLSAKVWEGVALVINRRQFFPLSLTNIRSRLDWTK